MCKVGEYYYALRGRFYKIYQVESIENGVISSIATKFIYETKEEARKKVYELNGW